jgi:hypothetical protein
MGVLVAHRGYCPELYGVGRRSFLFLYLCGTLIFWILVGVLAFTRPNPGIIERIVIGLGPQLIFWTIFIGGNLI